MAPFDRSHTRSYILHRLRDKVRYWSKIAIFHTHLVHNPPPPGKVVATILVLFSSQQCRAKIVSYPSLSRVHQRYRRQTDDTRNYDDNSLT